MNAGEAGLAVRWIWTQGKNIEQAFWAYEGSHVVFLDEDQLWWLSLETYGAPHLQALRPIKKHTSIAYAESSGTVWYLDPVHGHLMVLELLPDRALLPLPRLDLDESSGDQGPAP